MSDTTKTKKFIQGIAFMVFIIGLPLGSWYYLQKGFDYNKGLMSELQDYGRMPDFKLIDQDGDTVARKNVNGKIVVIDFFNRTENSYAPTMDYLRRMTGQFHDRGDMVFLSHSLGLESVEELKAIAKREELNNNQNFFLTADEAYMTRLLAEYQIPDLANRAEDKTIPRNGNVERLPKDYPYFILVDVSGTIRNYYDLRDEESVIRLVEHIAIILPRTAEEKAELIRETEK